VSSAPSVHQFRLKIATDFGGWVGYSGFSQEQFDTGSCEWRNISGVSLDTFLRLSYGGLNDNAWLNCPLLILWCSSGQTFTFKLRFLRKQLLHNSILIWDFTPSLPYSDVLVWLMKLVVELLLFRMILCTHSIYFCFPSALLSSHKRPNSNQALCCCNPPGLFIL